MGKESLESADFDILKLVHEKGSLSSNEIWDEIEGNRNRALERVNRLVTRKFLHVEKWKKCLTEKGRLVLLQNDVDGLREILDRINALTQGIAESKMLDQLRETERKKVREFAGAKDLSLEDLPARLEEMFTVDLTVEEKKQQAMNIINAYSGTFRRALRTMQQLSPSFARSPQTRKSLLGKEFYTHVTEEGLVDALLEDEIEELLRIAPDIQSHTF